MFKHLDFAIPLAPSGVSVRKRSKYKSESVERLREFRDKCSDRVKLLPRDTDVFRERSQLKSNRFGNATKNNVKNVVFIEDLNFWDKIQQFGAFGSVVALLEVAEKRKVRNKSFDFY